MSWRERQRQRTRTSVDGTVSPGHRAHQCNTIGVILIYHSLPIDQPHVFRFVCMMFNERRDTCTLLLTEPSGQRWRRRLMKRQ